MVAIPQPPDRQRFTGMGRPAVGPREME